MKPYIGWSEYDSGMEFQHQLDDILEEDEFEEMPREDRKELIKLFLKKSR